MYRPRTWHFVNIWFRPESPYRDEDARRKDFQTELGVVVEAVRAQTRETPRILLVDDSDKTGESMRRAKTCVLEVVEDAEVRTAALAYLGPEPKRPNYCNHRDDWRRELSS